MINGGLIESAAQIDRPENRRLFGITVAQVISNYDETNQGRVQVRLPWLPGIEPWARVATMNTGNNQGTYFIPQKDDEVLVGFNQGDLGDAYIVGSVWNGRDRPPVQSPSDASNIRKIQTTSGHQITFDDKKGSISIISASKQQIVIDAQKIEIASGNGKTVIRVEAAGSISLNAQTRIDIKAPTINIEADVLKMNGKQTANLQGGNLCGIKATTVTIN